MYCVKVFFWISLIVIWRKVLQTNMEILLMKWPRHLDSRYVCIYKIDYSSKLVGSLNEFIIRDHKDNVLCTLTSSLSSQTNSKSFSKNYISKIMRDKQHDATKIGHNFRKNNYLSASQIRVISIIKVVLLHVIDNKKIICRRIQLIFDVVTL